MKDATILRRVGKGSLTLSHDGSLNLPATEKSVALTIPAAEIARLVSADLVAVTKGRVGRTPTGDMYLRRSLAAMPDDAFAAQHRDIIVESRGGAEGLAVNAAESPLGWLATRRDKAGKPMLSRTQLEAGQRLARDHERGARRERVTQSWDASAVRGDRPRDGLTLSEAAHDARGRVTRALDAVGPDFAPVLVAVCCEEKGLETVEKTQGWPARCGKVILRLALDRLAQHYGMAPSVSGAARAGLVHWGSPDYRPAA